MVQILTCFFTHLCHAKYGMTLNIFRFYYSRKKILARIKRKFFEICNFSGEKGRWYFSGKRGNQNLKGPREIGEGTKKIWQNFCGKFEGFLENFRTKSEAFPDNFRTKFCSKNMFV